MRIEFSKPTKETLAKRVNYICSNPSCRCFTIGPNEKTNKSSSIGVAAHILPASSSKGPRYEENVGADEIASIENGIWLCYSCSVLIDKDPNRFPKELLKNWKTETENFVQTKLINHTRTEDKQARVLHIIKELNSQIKLVEIVVDIFEFSIIFKLDLLREVCTREINGWYFEELAQIQIDKVPEYRKEVVIQTFGRVKQSIGIQSADHFISELSKLKGANEQNYVFHEPLDELEKWTDQEFKEPQVLNQLIDANNLQFNTGEKIERDSYIWYTTNTVNAIVSNCRKYLKREIMKTMEKTT